VVLTDWVYLPISGGASESFFDILRRFSISFRSTCRAQIREEIFNIFFDWFVCNFPVLGKSFRDIFWRVWM